jgi:hypothetical protein
LDPEHPPTSDPPRAAAELSPLAPLGREEYIEQSHFFRTLGERLEQNAPAQEVLRSVREEVLATTKLPMALDFLLAELRHEGVMASAMTQLGHYFTPFQTFVVHEAENERGRFDLRLGLAILSREAEYRAGEPTRQGVFLYQFEALCRNRLGYDRGLEAVARDPAYDETWREWIRRVRRQVGMVDIADLIYVHSEYYRQRAAAGGEPEPGPDQRFASVPSARLASTSEPAERAGSSERAGASRPPAGRPAEPSMAPLQSVALFGEREGRIALANRHKDPLFLFSSLHRQLGYPEVPRPRPADTQQALLPQLARRLEQLEMRLRLVEEEQRGGIDLTKFYAHPGQDQSHEGDVI